MKKLEPWQASHGKNWWKSLLGEAASAVAQEKANFQWSSQSEARVTAIKQEVR